MSSTSTLSLLPDLMTETTPQCSPVSVTCCPQEALTQERTDGQTDGQERTDGQTSPSHTCSTSEEEEVKKTAMKKDSVLTEDEVSRSLSNLGHSADGLKHVYQFLSVPGRNLNDVSILCNYIHLQKLQLPYNRIKDLSCVSHMPYLIILDASHNELSNFFGFQPPKNLKEVNFSHNRLSVMKDLAAYSSLSKLKLDYNYFSKISGLEQCGSLTHLSLAHNKISRINGLDNLPLKHLCLMGNQIEKIENLETLRTLQVLDLSLNRIQSLSGLQDLHLLGSINLESNAISEIKEAKHIHDLVLLRELNLQRNLVQDQPDYRLSVVFLLQHLTGLDQKKVTAEEKVSAVNRYDPPLEVVAARDHMTHMVYQLMQPQVIYDSTLLSLDSPYPMLVLTGPQACGKRELAHKLCLEFSEFFAYGACHTTRDAYFGEEDGSDYHFVAEEDFQNMVHMVIMSALWALQRVWQEGGNPLMCDPNHLQMVDREEMSQGKFIQTMQYGGHWYGLSREAIEEVAREGLACCVHMELEGVFSLKNSYFEPRYVLLIPTDQEQYAQRLRSRGLYTQAQIDSAAARIGLYARVNRERPGFFDNVIGCDNPAEAYKTLRQVVKEYLGVEEQGGGDQSTRDTPDHLSTEMAGGSPADQRTTGPSRLETSSRSASPTGPTKAPPPSDSRNYRSKVQAQLAPQKTSAELASLHRKQQLVREALMGRSPGAYTQLFKRSAQTAPSSLASQILSSPVIARDSLVPHDHSDDSRAQALSSPLWSSVNYPKPSGSDDSRASSGLSIPSSAGAFSEAAAGQAGCSDLGSGHALKPTEVSSSLPHHRDSLKDQVEAPGHSDTPGPGSHRISQAATPASVRPGSDHRPILPPIPSGRKTPNLRP